jgi:ABC-type phosphate transport system permease subunit
MAVWMVIGGGVSPSVMPSPFYLFGATDTIPTLIALYYKQGESAESSLNSLMGAAFILFVIVGLLNIGIRRMLKKSKAESG